MSAHIGFERLYGATNLFSLRHADGGIRMLCAKVIDDFMFSGTAEDTRWFDEQIRKRFKVGRTILDEKMNFNGASIEQDQHESTQGVKESILNEEEIKQYRILAGKLNWDGRLQYQWTALVRVTCSNDSARYV